MITALAKPVVNPLHVWHDTVVWWPRIFTDANGNKYRVWLERVMRKYFRSSWGDGYDMEVLYGGDARTLSYKKYYPDVY